MGKTIIISSKSEKFISEQIDSHKQKIISSTLDTMDIDVEPKKSSIGILRMHELKKWVNIKPYSGENKIAFIHNAHLLTEEAQNSILKLLEEPHNDTTIILICNNYQSLLPTIISRCQILEDKGREIIEQGFIQKFMAMGTLEKFEYIELFEKVENKKFAIENFLKMLLNYFRAQLLEKKDKTIIEKLNLISEAKGLIDANVPAKNVLDNLLIQLGL
jgi:DNA polymerase-3 subunit delta'